MLRQPFTQPDQADIAYSVKPDEMSEPERKQFPHFAKEPKIFLSLRNLIISLWNLNIKVRVKNYNKLCFVSFNIIIYFILLFFCKVIYVNNVFAISLCF